MLHENRMHTYQAELNRDLAEAVRHRQAEVQTRLNHTQRSIDRVNASLAFWYPTLDGQ